MADRVQMTTEDGGMPDELMTNAPEVSEEAVAEERPEWLPEKFESAADLAKAYSELESRMGSQESPESEEVTEDVDASDREALTMDDIRPFSEEFAEKGELGEESYQKLDELGFPRELVDNYIQGMAAYSQQQSTQMMAAVGGEESYNQMTDWASKNLSEAEINAYNSIMDSGDPSQIDIAVRGMHARFKANDTEPSLIQGDTVNVNNGFNSTAEVTAAINDPRYRKDPAYRKEVQQKIQMSKVL